jgi:hypothetical protein
MVFIGVTPRGGRLFHAPSELTTSGVRSDRHALRKSSQDRLGRASILAGAQALGLVLQQEHQMSNLSGIREHMEVIGADGVHVGTVDKVEGDRIKLTRNDSGEGHHQGHHHFVPGNLVAEVEGQRVRLSANAANAVLEEEEENRGPLN